MTNKAHFTHRIARQRDIPDIINLMQLSIEENMKAFLTAEEIEANKESMGVDQTLIDDGTYFIIESAKDGEIIMVGCGGLGKSRTHSWGENTRRFMTIELGSTVPGEPLYLARGYVEMYRETKTAANGYDNIIIKMSKSL